MRKFLLGLVIFFCFSQAEAQPKINSFSPTAGPAGTNVIITGNNFNPVASENIVFIGAAVATVTNATTTTLTVVVPTGASYDPITVTANGFTAYSRFGFILTFPGAGPTFTATSFLPHQDFAAAVWPFGICNTDFDADGKPDLAMPSYQNEVVSVLKNNSTPGNVQYADKQDYPSSTNSNGIHKGDLDGDGKPDIVIANTGTNTISVFRNTSTPGNISFAVKKDFATGLNPRNVRIGDIDGDGKPDVISCNTNSFTFSVYRNISTGGNINFDAPLSFPSGFAPRAAVITDLDGDGKPDVAVASEGSNFIAVYRNTSTPGNVTLVQGPQFPTPNRPADLAEGDLDGDGKTDLITPNNGNGNISVFRNVSTPGVITFLTSIEYPTGIYPQRLAIGDLDGDGKPEIALSSNENFNSQVAVFKNNCSVGVINFMHRVNYTTAPGLGELAIGDVDGDGKPDIMMNAHISNKVSILINNTVCTAAAVQVSPADKTVCENGTVTFTVGAVNATTYQWQENTGSGWADISNNAIYAGATTTSLQVTGVVQAMNNYRYRCVVSNTCGSSTSAAALLSVQTPSAPAITISTVTQTICAGSTAVFTATPINGGAAPVYQWKKNSIVVGANAASYTDNSIANGDIITCTLTSNSDCATTPNAVSNSITMLVTAPAVPGITISASATVICSGTAVTFTALPVNGGATPGFQWYKNSIAVGTGGNTYTDNILINGDAVSCVMTSTLSCVTSPSAASNAVIMNVSPSVTPTIVISASTNDICPGTPVIFMASITEGGASPSYQWKKNGAPTGTNQASYTDNLIAEGDVITCLLTSTSTAACLTSSTAISNPLLMELKKLPGNVNLGPDKLICTGTTIDLSAPGYDTYLWQDGSTGTVLTVNTPGTYHVTATDACGNRSQDFITLLPGTTPAGFLGKDTAVCSYSSVTLLPSEQYVTYLWSNNATTSSVSVSTPGEYWLQVTNADGCKGRDTIRVSPKNCSKGMYMPNAFTPDGNGRNDVFKPAFFGTVKQYSLRIYNRYGQAVFYSSDPAQGWNGRFKGIPQDGGVFIWECVYQLDNMPLQRESGSVLIIR